MAGPAPASAPGSARRTIVLTGATSGIGRVAALTLASQGHRVLAVGRNPELLDALQRAARSHAGASPGGAIEPFRADLSRMAEVRRVAGELAAAAPVIDVLVNNAGAIFGERQLTAEGLERTFALNHAAYWLLTKRLLPNVAASTDGRVVSTASAAHRRARLDLTDLQGERGYDGWMIYGNSKLANILFTRELARRLALDPATRHVSATCLHPGFVASRFGDANAPLFAGVIKAAKLLVARTEEQGADTLLWLATAPGAAERAGGYFDRRKPGRLSAAARDDATAARLWDATATLLNERP